MLALAEGEYLLDNAEATPANSTNYMGIANSTFESGVASWVFRGTHIRSTLETTLPGFNNSSRSLHVRASARGEHRAIHSPPSLAKHFWGAK